MVLAMNKNENETTTGRKSIVSDITASGIFGILNTSFMVSYATLIFAKTCPDYFGTAVALFLLGACAVSILLALMSTYPGTIGSIQDVPSAISAIIAVSFAQVLTSASPASIFANIFVAIALSTVLTGICFLLLGYFKLGNLVRFIPYPVLGGFLAATGWLLFTGGIQVSTGVALKIVNIAAFIQQVDVVPLIMGLTFGFGLLFMTTRYSKNMLITPSFILLSIIIFLVVTLSIGMSIDQLKADGWLLGPLPDGALWRAVSLPDFSLVHWPLVFKHAGSITTIVVLSAISFLLNSSGIEIIAGRDLDMNKDLKATGIANLVTSIIAAPASYVLVSQTALATRIGATSRLVGVLQGVFLLLIFFVGGAFLSFFPKFVAGGLLLFLGTSMLKEWIIDSRKSIPRIDYGIIVGIVLIVEFFGFLQGVAMGIVASVVIFVFRYSSINIIKNVMDGTHIRSGKDRPITDQRMLDHHADQLEVLQLQGFIFFGTANSLYENVKQLTSSDDKHLRFVILDLKLVQGIDSSAVKSFAKLALHLEKEDIALVLTNLTGKLRVTFEADGFTSTNYTMLREYADLDLATEYCEDQIIKAETEKLQQAKQDGRDVDSGLMQAVYSDMMAALEIQVLFETLIERMKPYLEKLKVSEGYQLYKQKALSRDIYFIERGQVTLSRTNSEGESTRIRTLGPWTITGELGAFLAYRSPYDADVVKGGIVQKLSAENCTRMETDDPDLASEFQRLIIIMLGNQLMKTSRVVGNIRN
jgi:SulP family sulfate permease